MAANSYIPIQQLIPDLGNQEINAILEDKLEFIAVLNSALYGNWDFGYHYLELHLFEAVQFELPFLQSLNVSIDAGTCQIEIILKKDFDDTANGNAFF